MTKLFTVGPVEIAEDVLRVGALQPPYFRDPEFADVVSDVCHAIPRLMHAPAGSRAALLTASGTAAMEAAVINLFDDRSEVLVVDGGPFGRRFAEICDVHRIPHRVLTLEPGTDLERQHLEPYRGVDGVLLVAHETSTGQLYDVRTAGAFCRDHGALLVVDAISSFLADPFTMGDWHVNTVVISVNKGLAIPPGLSFVVMDEQSRGRLLSPRSLYLRLEDYFRNGERGQTPYTPAINVVLQLQHRLTQIEETGGPDAVVARVAAMAADFRRRAADLGLETFPATASNYLTALRVPRGVSVPLYERLKSDYDFYINPSTWGFSSEVPKVCHAGELCVEDNRALVAGLRVVLGELGALS